MGRIDPKVWLLISDKPGDNAQARVLADALGWAYETKQLFPKTEWMLGKPAFRPGMQHLDLARSANLKPPWPDLIITIGRRCAMAALWAQDQSAGQSRIVLIGRPKRQPERFALIVAPGQFRIPSRSNLVQLDLPLLRADADAVAAATIASRDRFAALPRPLTAVLVGGPTKPYRFDAETARDLVRCLRTMLARDGGSLYVTTSRRTGAEVTEALASALPEGTPVYRWSAAADADNPYLALLGLADRFVVTGDSISMMVEVASLGRPLAIFPLPVKEGLANRVRAARATLVARAGGGVAGRLVHLLHRLGIVSYARDLTAIHRCLIQRGLAVRLGEPFHSPAGRLEDELDQAVARIHAMFVPDLTR
jgi:mitochondrial fission protein ELM1